MLRLQLKDSLLSATNHTDLCDSHCPNSVCSILTDWFPSKNLLLYPTRAMANCAVANHEPTAFAPANCFLDNCTDLANYTPANCLGNRQSDMVDLEVTPVSISHSLGKKSCSLSCLVWLLTSCKIVSNSQEGSYQLHTCVMHIEPLLRKVMNVLWCIGLFYAYNEHECKIFICSTLMPLIRLRLWRWINSILTYLLTYLPYIKNNIKIEHALYVWFAQLKLLSKLQL